MSENFALSLSQSLLWKAIIVASPIMLALLALGLILSILQTATQIQDSTLSTAPKLLIVVIMLMFCGEWMLRNMMDFSYTIFLAIPQVSP